MNSLDRRLQIIKDSRELEIGCKYHFTLRERLKIALGCPIGIRCITHYDIATDTTRADWNVEVIDK